MPMPTQYALWLLKHSADAPAIVADAELVLSAPTIDAKWTATKALGDLIVADLKDFPHDAPLLTSESHAELAAKFNFDPAKFANILALIQQLIALFGGK